MISVRMQKIFESHHRDHQISDLIFGLKEHQTLADPGAESKQHQIKMLQCALQAAVTLEFATLPPYLTAIWSVKDDLHPVAKSLREILQEEMLHMALACNLLSSIGGTPKISSAVPEYPGKLPLNIHPELTIPITGLSEDSLKIFMEIERPNHPGHFMSLKAEELTKNAESAVPGAGDHDETIGEFYDQILKAFESIQPELSTEHQISGPLAWFVVSDLGHVKKAIHTIQVQGEGSTGSPDSSMNNHAHYYRFSEILERKQLEFNNKNERWEYTTPIELDYKKDVLPIGEVPPGGYPLKHIGSEETMSLLKGFNVQYSKLLDLLDQVWTPEGGQASFWKAIEVMFSLEKFAKPLMRTPFKDGLNFAPEWKYIPKEERAHHDYQ